MLQYTRSSAHNPLWWLPDASPDEFQENETEDQNTMTREAGCTTRFPHHTNHKLCFDHSGSHQAFV
jgi:hypothetical protein